MASVLEQLGFLDWVSLESCWIPLRILRDSVAELLFVVQFLFLILCLFLWFSDVGAEKAPKNNSYLLAIAPVLFVSGYGFGVLPVDESALAPVDPDWGVGVQPEDPSLPPAREKKVEPSLSHWAVSGIVVIVIACFFFSALLLVGACLPRGCLIARVTRRVVSVDFEL
ncbi:hypothetical protein Sjap_004412 [Stephania japonica]|uniref:Transmembrane protein n=1 Tax=Stephania japonica TaxID=461633 RepID=A0AAP0K377_9MAGN